MKLTSPTIDRPEFFLYDSERSRLNPYNGNEFQWQATSTGTFYIAAYVRKYSQEVGPYKLVVNRLPDDDHGYDLQTASQLALDQKTEGALTWPDDEDFFSFEAVEGAQYLIDLDRETGTQEGGLSLLDTNGEQIVREYHIDDITWIAPISGTYYIEIEHNWRLEKYSIILTLSDYVDDHGDSFENATPISFDQSIDGYLAWRDTDFFKFNVENGRSYQIDFERETVHLASTWKSRLFGADGEHIEWTYSEIDDKTYRMTFQADQHGVYFVAVDAYRGRGAYAISFDSSD